MIRTKAILLAALMSLLLPLSACEPSSIGQGGKITTEQSQAKNCDFDDNIDLTADQFISKSCKSSIRREFPGDYYGRTLREIARDRSKNDKKANKLLRQDRFRK